MILPVAYVAFQTATHHFSLVAPAAETVTVAGDFNGWNKDANPMQRQPDGRTWTIDLPLTYGKHAYKFVVNGGTWLLDPAAERNEDDGNGNTNSIVTVTPDDYKSPAIVGDGIITMSALRHEGNSADLNFDRGRLTFTLRSRPHDIAHIYLHIEGRRDVEMRETGGDDLYARNTASIGWDHRDLQYDFRLKDGKTTVYFGPNGATTTPTGNEFQLDAAKFKSIVVPAWVEKSVIYQIFPDRFANGDPTNDPKGVVPWETAPTFSNFMGGDLAGIKAHLPYLKSLGVDCVYFNPLFKGPTNHHYETTDYLQIDPAFGTNAEFKSLTAEMNKRGIRTVLDGVFNHTSTKFFAFDDVVAKGAASPYVHWYTFRGFPVKVGPNPNYVAWFGYPSMPKLNHSNAQVRSYLFGVPQYWAKNATVAGWRLDAANEVPFDFWREFRTKVKAINPDDWIVGEFWGDATPWLQGDMWDSVMNYQFKFAVDGFVGQQGDGRPSTLSQKLMATYDSYPPQVDRNLMNVIDSHDTPRILSTCGGDRRLSALAAMLQFSWVGVPSVYYGDELGMEGGKDPDNRRCMQWELVNDENPTLTLYKSLIAARSASPELQSGDPDVIVSDDNTQTFGFARRLGGSAALAFFNRSTAFRSLKIDLKKAGIDTRRFVDVLNRREVACDPDGTMVIPLEGLTGLVLVPKGELPAA